MNHIIPALFCLALLGGCATLPQEATQSVIIPAEETRQSYALDDEWWKAYGQDELNETVNLALGRNIDLAKAAVSVNKALYQARLIGADMIPTFSADASAQSARNISTHASSVRTFQGGLGLSYEFDLWRRFALATTAQEWEYKATVQDLQASRLALINSVTDTWFDVKYLRQALALAKETAVRHKRLHEIVKAKHEAGKVASVEPLQTEQALLSAEDRVLTTDTQLATALATMRNLLNLTPDEHFPENTADLLDIPFATPDLNVPIASLSARPDVAAAEARLNRMFNTMKAQERAWFPKITLGGSLNVSSDSHTTFFDVPFLSGMVKISFPFLDWETLRWQTKSAEADFEHARLSFTSAVTTAVNEVNSAYVQYRAAAAAFENAKAKAKADAAIADYYSARYKAGAAELKDALEALNSTATSMASALEAKYKALSWETRIYQAMGGRYVTKD